MREGEIIEAQVTRLGGAGDGIAQAGTKQLYVPLALPGETVRVKLGKPLGDSFSAQLVEVVTPSPNRVQPPCPHFAQCGGCSLQHLAGETYKEHKRNVVAEALRQHKLTDIEVRETLVMPAASRRRLSMAALHTKDGAILGFNARASHTVVNVQTCPIARPELVEFLPKLRAVLGPWLAKAKSLDITLTLTPSGIDVLITGAEPDLIAREAIAILAKLPSLARISWRAGERKETEPLLGLREPIVTFGKINVPFPPGAFLQASQQGETTLTQLVKGAVREVEGKVADLFAGLGTFTFPLAETHEVVAVESDRAAVTAMQRALHFAGKVTAEQRDLFRDPLSSFELDSFGAVVFDPPRAGAQAQVAELAQSDVPVVVAVSCNPGTFARDAAKLIEGGYVCEWVQPVDQFIWSSHVELVARFTKAG